MRLGGALALALAWLPVPGFAQEPTPAPKPIGAVAAVSGKATILHAAQREELPAKVEESVFVRDKITTSDLSVIRVLMGGRISLTIRERSIVSITDDPTRTRIDLQEGRLAFKVHEGGLRVGEVAELRTPNAITGIRGSLIVANVTGFDSEITVVEARHAITIATRTAPARTTTIPVGHTVRVSGQSAAARISPVVRAPKAHLDRAADTAEVPGRPKDGGQERLFRFDPKIGRLLPTAAKATEGKAGDDKAAEGKTRESDKRLVAPEGRGLAAPEGRGLATPEGKAVIQPGGKEPSAPARVLGPPAKRDEPAAAKREEPAAARVAPGAPATPAPAPPAVKTPAAAREAPAAVKEPAAVKTPARQKRVTPGVKDTDDDRVRR